MEIRVGAVDSYRLVPNVGLHAELLLPMEFDEGRFSARIDQAKRMHSEAFHESKRPMYRAIGHNPHRHVDAFRTQRDEIPKIVVRGLGLRESAIWFLFSCIDQVAS